jgi:hypothetical protein
MFRHFAATTLSLAVLLSPMATSAENFVFRYKMQAAGTATPGDPEFGIGNNVQAWFVAPVGYPFLKDIPVATRDVVEWSKSSGSIPDGLALDTATGEISGKASREQTADAIWYGLDASGKRIARAELHFSAFKPVGQVTEVNWYTHTGQYFYSQIPAPTGIEVVRWDPIVDLPQGTDMRNGAFEGTPAKAAPYGIAWRGYDYLNREVAFTYGEFLVQDKPVVEEIADQTVDKSLVQYFSVVPQVRHSIGTLTFALKPASARPAGLAFRSDDGYLHGVYETYDTTAKFVIEARDSGDGSVGRSNEFSLTTMPEALDISNIPDLTGAVGQYQGRRIATTYSGAMFDVIAGLLPDGIKLDRETGSIYGTPTQPEKQEGIRIGISGDAVAPTTSNAFDFRIYSALFEVATNPVHVRIGKPFRSDVPTVLTTQDPPYTYAAGGTLPDGVAFDAEKGQYFSSGLATSGTYDQHSSMTNASGLGRGNMQIIRVYNYPTLAYANPAEGGRFLPVSIEPKLPPDSVHVPNYALTQGSLPAFLKLDPATGVLSGTPTALGDIGGYGPFVISMTDTFGEAPVVSNAFTIRIGERPDLQISQSLDKIQRWVYQATTAFAAPNAYNGVRFVLKDRGNLPSTMNVSETGQIYGNTSDPVGTVYSGIVVQAVDGTGFTADIPASFTVVEPRDIASLDGNIDKTFTWTVGRDFLGFGLPRVTNIYGQTDYEVGANSLGLSVNQSTLAVSGNALAVGTYAVPYTISDQTDRAPIQGMLTFVIQPEMSVSHANVDTYRGTQVSIAPMRTNGVAPFTWKIASGNLPGTGLYPPMAFDTATGTISGKPREEGSFPLTLSVTDATQQTEAVSFTLEVKEPLPFSFDYDGDQYMLLNRHSQVVPRFTNISENVIWTFVDGTLPSGVIFSETGSYAGMFTGSPTEDGLFDSIHIKGVDTGTGEEYTAGVTLKILRTGNVGFPVTTHKHRAGDSIGTFAVAPSNVTDPSTYEIVGNPYPGNVSIDANTGVMSVAFPQPGKYTVTVKVTDLFGRPGSANELFDVVGGLSLAAPDPAQFKRFSQGSVPLTVRNLIGTGSYVTSGIPSTLTAAKGAISGTPDTVGTFPGSTVTLTDSYDSASATTSPFTLDVAERDPLVLTAPDYQTNQYKTVDYRPIAANTIGTVEWTISPALPDVFSFDAATGRITGMSEVLFEQAYVLTATDSKGAPLGTDTKTFTLKIVDREKPEITTPSTVNALLDSPYAITLGVKNILGAAVWEHVSGDLPEGLSFNPATHVITGEPTAYGLVSGILFRVTDTYKGIATVGEKLISIDVKQDGSPIILAVDNTLPFRQGEFSQSVTPVAENTVGDVTWTAEGLDGKGVAIDPATGVISGSSTAAGNYPVTVTVSDITGRSQGKLVTVEIVPPLEIVFPTTNALIYNYTLARQASQNSLLRSPTASTAGVQPQGENTYGTPVWSISPTTGLPAGLTFNPATGRFDGKPLQLGTFGPFTLTLKDALPGQDDLHGVILNVTMNDDPIDLSVEPYVTKIGYPIRTAAPVYDNALGDIRFFPENNDLGGTNLSLDTDTGVLTGSSSTPQDRNVNIAIADEYTSRVTSVPLHLQVLPRLVLTGPQKASIEAQAQIVPVVVTPTNVAGTLAWYDLPTTQKALLPEGVTFDPATGTFVGKTDTLGTFGPFNVSAVDTFIDDQTDAATSNDILLEVKVGSVYLKLADGALMAGQKLKTYSDTTVASKLNAVGMDSSEIQWSMFATGDQQVPGGLQINGSTGVITGTPGKAGDFAFTIRVSGKGRISDATYTMHVEPPVFDLELKDPGTFNAVSWSTKSFDLRGLVSFKTANINLNSIIFTSTLNPVPSRVSVSGQTLNGTFTHADDYVFTIKGTYTVGSDSVSATTDVKLHVTDPVEQAWRYWTIRFSGNVAGAFEFTGSPNDAKVAEIQLLDAAGNVLSPVDGYTYYHHKAVTKTINGVRVSTWTGDDAGESRKAWDGNPSTYLTDGLGSGFVIEFGSPTVVRKVRMTMTGTPQDVVNIQSLRSNNEGWCGGCGWLQHSSDYQPLPAPAGGGKSYAAGEVVEFNLYPGAP